MTKHTIEIYNRDNGLEGGVNVGIDGFALIHRDWLKDLILDAGFRYVEVTD